MWAMRMSWRKLLDEQRVERHKATKREIDDLRAAVERNLTDAGITGLSADNRFGIAYEAVLLPAKMAVACAGYRVKGPGAHKTMFAAVELAMGAGVSNLIDDLTPLAGLTQLYDLSVAFNKIVDLSPLSGLTGLSHLWADDNLIADLSPLAGLHALTWLRVERNRFTDLTPLAGLTALESLGIGDNAIADTSPLVGLTALETLTMNTTGLTALDFVAGMSLLSVLHAGNNHIVDLGPVSDLAQLSYLQVSYNLITDLAPLLANTGLGEGDRVLLRQNPLSATALNEQIPALTARGVIVEQ